MTDLQTAFQETGTQLDKIIDALRRRKVAIVNFDPGEGTIQSDWIAPTYYVGEPFGRLPEITHPEADFLGWKLNSIMGDYVYTSTIVPSEECTLIARFGPY